MSKVKSRASSHVTREATPCISQVTVTPATLSDTLTSLAPGQTLGLAALVLHVLISPISADQTIYTASGCIHPAAGPMKRDSAWRVAKVGPVTAWSINCGADAVQVELLISYLVQATALSHYIEHLLRLVYRYWSQPTMQSTCVSSQLLVTRRCMLI